MFKYISALIIATSSLTASAIDMKEYARLHPAGFGIQIVGGGLDLAYYSQNHDYLIAIGSVSFKSEKTDKVKDTSTTATYEGETEAEFSTSLYLRKNFPLTERTNFGIGASIGKKFPTSADTCGIKKSYLASQYFSIEHALTEKLFLLASVKPVKYEYVKTTDGNTDGENTNNISIFAGGSVQLTYLI